MFLVKLRVIKGLGVYISESGSYNWPQGVSEVSFSVSQEVGVKEGWRLSIKAAFLFSCFCIGLRRLSDSDVYVDEKITDIEEEDNSVRGWERKKGVEGEGKEREAAAG